MQPENSHQDPAAGLGTNTNIAPSMGYSYIGNPTSPFTATRNSYGYTTIDAQPGAPAQNQTGSMGTGTTRHYMPSVSGGMNLYQPLPLNSTVYTHQKDDDSYQQHPASQLDDMHVPSYASYTGVNGTPPYGTPPSDLNTHFGDPEEGNFIPFDYHQLPRDFTRSSPSSLHIHGFDSSTSYAPGSSETEHGEPVAIDTHQPLPSSANKRKIAQPRARRPVQKNFTPPSSSASRTPPLEHVHEISPPRGSSRLIYNGFADAEAKAYNRSRLNIGGDDWHHIKNNPAEHVEKLVAAFDLPYGDVPEYHQLSDADQEQWISYQEAHMEKMNKFSPEQIEASCWVLLKNIIEAHEIGVKRLRYHRSDYIEKCSTHVERIAEAIALYAVIRFDVVRLQRFDELVSTTSSAIQRKISNFKGNWGKTKRELENDERAKEVGFEYKKVLGEKKRKADDEVAPPKAKRRSTKNVSDLYQRIEATLEGGQCLFPSLDDWGIKIPSISRAAYRRKTIVLILRDFIPQLRDEAQSLLIVSYPRAAMVDISSEIACVNIKVDKCCSPEWLEIFRPLDLCPILLMCKQRKSDQACPVASHYAETAPWQDNERRARLRRRHEGVPISFDAGGLFALTQRSPPGEPKGSTESFTSDFGDACS
ncbi:uncharacterized protein MYCFIDRAFT_178818 [Pseudocercospora fijiensis CIRAD86]|uniref:Uncharacterized protein n=1 Tax=Pseudocercospora fijiensis (strain CIRAD86) TaxID=383855 RepID=M3AMN5_PSEFD|nr:uncharacterized protein MYCFIDRAFT_178818 [Pseudocercospora fijiensis CIRAD86]EME78707.1 hypothetical protein MYCFIDRAFT_178818 [Pseudocercospora fijiensis CIRAD86]